MIPAHTGHDVKVLNNRYAVVKDVRGIYRVVSLVRTPYKELAARYSGGDICYTFDRTGTNYNKTSYGQRALQNLVNLHGKPPTPEALIILQQQAVRFNSIVDVALSRSKPSDLKGTPTLISNKELHPAVGGWIIATASNKGLVFGTHPKVHLNHEVACVELTRLANAHPGKEFVLFKADRTATVAAVQTKVFQ